MTDLPATPSLVALPLLVIIGAAWFAINRVLFRDLLSPFALLFVAWVMPLILQATNLSLLETPWRTASMVLVGYVTFALAATCLLAGRFVDRSSSGDEFRAIFLKSLADLRRPAALVTFFLCYALSFGAYLYSEFLTNPVGVPLLAYLQGDALPIHAIHRWGKDTPWVALSSLLFVLTPLAYLAARANRGRAPLRFVLLLLAVLYPVMGVLKLSRSDVFVGMIGLVLAVSYAKRFGPAAVRRRKPIVRYASLGAGMLLLYYAMMSVRLGGMAAEDLYARAIGFRLDGPLRGAAAATYGYVGMPFENLHRFLDSHDWSVLHPGVSVTRPFLSITGQGDLADRLDAEIRYPPPATFAAGSATFLTGVLAEGGLIGAALVPVLYAVLINGVYLRMRYRPTVVNVLLYANFVNPWVWLFFNNGFGVLGIYLNAAFILAIGRAIDEAKGQRPAGLAPLGA